MCPEEIEVVRVGRVELPSGHWKCPILPLNDTRKNQSIIKLYQSKPKLTYAS